MSRDAPERPGEGSSPPIDSHWYAKEEELVRVFGRDFRLWLRELVPHADDGQRLVLAAPSGFVRDHVTRDYLDKLRKVLDRRIDIIVTRYAHARAAKLRATV